MNKTTKTDAAAIAGSNMLSPVFRKSINTTIKNLKEHVDSIKGLGCTFWACEGHESGRIKSMITCDRCRSIIINQREINRLQSILK